MRKVEILTTSGRCYAATIDSATASYLYTQVVAKDYDRSIEITDVNDGTYFAIKADLIESIITWEAKE